MSETIPETLQAGTGELPTVVESILLYEDSPGAQTATWKMAHEVEAGGAGEGGTFLELNFNHAAQAFAGFKLVRNHVVSHEITVTQDWIDRGYLTFQLNPLVNRDGFPEGGVQLQVRPLLKDHDRLPYRKLLPEHAEGGHQDEDVTTWQAVNVPLNYWPIRAGEVIAGIWIQTINRASISFGVDELGYTLYSARLPTPPPPGSEPVKAIWPAYSDLPQKLKAAANKPRVQDGKFVGPDGKRVFILQPWSFEDDTFYLFGKLGADSPQTPSHGLYSDEHHAWIYEQRLSEENLSRLGFNTASVNMASQPWWRAVGVDAEDTRADASKLKETLERLGVPIHADLVAFPWTLGRANSYKGTNLRPSAFTVGRHHWTPWRFEGAGWITWLDVWELYARRYRDVGAQVLTFELMNEPASSSVSALDIEQYKKWLFYSYDSLDDLNKTWGSSFSDWDDVLFFASTTPSDIIEEMKEVPGRWLDYDEHRAFQLARLVRVGVAVVSDVLPDTLVGLQPMGGYLLQPREAVWKHLIIPHETVVMTPTSGGRWTPGTGASTRPQTTLDSPMARAPIEMALLLSMAGDKMIMNNESYVGGKDARQVRNRLWREVITGVDVITIFDWSPRRWVWNRKENVRDEAQRFGFNHLNPWAHRTESLLGINQFAAEMQEIADVVLPRGNTRPAIALLYDWAQARRVAMNQGDRDRAGAYYAALKYSHWNVEILPSHMASSDALDRYDVVIAAGLDYVSPDLLENLEAYVRTGGVLLVGEGLMGQDVYGQPTDNAWLGLDESFEQIKYDDIETVQVDSEDIPMSGTVEVRRIRGVATSVAAEWLIGDDANALIGSVHLYRRGLIYTQMADVSGYGLAKLLWYIIDDAARQSGCNAVPYHWRAADILDPERMEIATNILILRRSHADRHVILLSNEDKYAKRIELSLNGLRGNWTARNLLSSGEARAMPLPIDLAPEEPAVVLIERR